jgi:hypothetical protein
VTVDRVYVAACARDVRLMRICVASIRYFHPDAPIQILAGGVLPAGAIAELRRHWGIEVASLPRGDYGWGFVKLEPLFGPPSQRFLVLDADTVFTGKVLDAHADSVAPFLVDDERFSDAEFKRLYYDWEALTASDPAAVRGRAFNVGQWFGTAGLIGREAFDPWLEWTLPRRLRRTDAFMGGDQGVLNYVLLQEEAQGGVEIDRRPLMRWPGHGLDGLDPASVSAGTAPPLVIHWAGMKANLLRGMPGGDLLQFFEDRYYERLPLGRFRRRLALWRHLWTQWSAAVGVRARLRLRTWFKPRVGAEPPPLVKEAIPS